MKLTSIGSALALLFAIELGCQGHEFPTQEGTAEKGDLVISITTIGTLPDADGYVVAIEGQEPRRVAANQELVLSLRAGRYQIQLEDLSEDCVVHGEKSWVRYVTSRMRASVAVEVDCRASGSIIVTTTTQGSDLDPDGYLVVLDRSLRGSIGLQGKIRLTAVHPGSYELQLRGLIDNCSDVRGLRRNIAVEEGKDTTISFQLECAARQVDAPGDYLVVARRTSDEDLDLYLVSMDGHLRRRLTDDPADDFAPSFSPDGARVLFTRSGPAGVSLISLDRSSGLETPLPVQAVYPVHWSPDGSRILYANEGGLYQAKPDGTGATRLSDASAGEAFWSPDGAQIAFTRGSGRSALGYVINSDGTNLRRLTKEGRVAGPWSPDGTKLLIQISRPQQCGYYYYYHQCDNTALAVLELSTGTEKALTGFGRLKLPVWLPEGDRILFLLSGSVFAIPATGGNPVSLTTQYEGDEWFTVGRVR